MSAKKQDSRELSRGKLDSTSNDDGHTWNRESVNMGSLQRIADACERFATAVELTDCRIRNQIREADRLRAANARLRAKLKAKPSA